MLALTHVGKVFTPPSLLLLLPLLHLLLLLSLLFLFPLYISLWLVILCSVSLIKTRIFWTYSQTNWKKKEWMTKDSSFHHCKLLADSLHFRLFYSLILGTISMPGFISTPNKGGFCWCLHCSKCYECQMADSHLATLRNGNSALPLQSPMGLEKEHRKCLLISRISGDRKNMFNEALRCFTEQKKNPLRFCLHMPLRGGGQEGKQRGKCVHTTWSVFCTHWNPEDMFPKTTVGRLS